MTTPSQLGTLQTEIDDLKAEILSTKEALAAAQTTPEIEFLRKQLEQLNNTRNLLQEEKNILLRGQASDEEQEIWLPACFAIPWLLGQQVRQKKQQLHQTKENARQIKSKKFS